MDVEAAKPPLPGGRPKRRGGTPCNGGGGGSGGAGGGGPATPLLLRVEAGGSGSGSGSGGGGSGSGVSSMPRAALRVVRHPACFALLYMALGGGIAYCMLGMQAGAGGPRPCSSSSSSSGGGGRDGSGGGGAVALAAPQPMDAATLREAADAAGVHASAARAAAERGAARRARPPLCSDTCHKARDGVCDDGRYLPNATAAQEVYVLCDLGTDCDDCGPWDGAAHSAAWNESQGPIEYLRRRGIEVRARRAALPPKFWFAYTHPGHDVDVSAFVSATGVVEQTISQIFYHVLHKPCSLEGDGLLVDVGANFGWFSVLAATLGCSVVAFEPVPHFRAFFEYNLARNGLTDRVQVRPTVAAAYPGTLNYTVVVPQRGIWGTAGIDGANIDDLIDNEGEYQQVKASGEVLDEVLEGRSVKLLKVDVEGYEPQVMQGAVRLLAAGAVDNIVMEYSPHVAEKGLKWDELSAAPRMLERLLSPPRGFTIGQIAHRNAPGAAGGYDAPLPLFPQVTAANLAHDIADARLITRHGVSWAREPCPEMSNHGLIVDGMPERFHPKSFRSAININTNVWASRDPALAAHLRGPPVGVIPANQSLRAGWFAAEGSDLGSGGRSCEGLRRQAAAEKMDARQRASMLVSHHCRCAPDAPCAKQEAIADGCARRGATPWDD